MSRNAPSSTLLIYGRRAALVATAIVFAGVCWNMTHQPKREAPSAEGISATTEPADKFDPAAANICGKSIDSLLMCEALKKQYPALTSATINAAVLFSKFYGHPNPSGLLALQLLENKGDTIEGGGDKSTAFGPFHYLVDSFCGELITDVKVVGKTIRKKNALLLTNVKRHFHNPATVDDLAARCSQYMADTRRDLDALTKMPKNLTQEQLAAERQVIKDRVRTRRSDMRKMMLAEFPNEIVAIQYVHKLMNTDPQKLYDGSVYAEHMLYIVGAEKLRELIERERATRETVAKAVAEKKPVKPTQVISAARIQQMLAQINIANHTTYKEFVIPPYTGEIYPAFTKEFSGRAPGNFSVFFKVQKLKEEKLVAAKVKGAAPIKTVILRRIITPRTAAEVQEEIARRWEEHHKNARPLDAFARQYTATPTAPTVPNVVRTAQNAVAVPATN